MGMIKIKNYFFSKGVCLVEHKSYDLHPELQIINTEVAKYFKSLVSRGISRKIFVWRHAYHFITIFMNQVSFTFHFILFHLKKVKKKMCRFKSIINRKHKIGMETFKISFPSCS